MLRTRLGYPRTQAACKAQAHVRCKLSVYMRFLAGEASWPQNTFIWCAQK